MKLRGKKAIVIGLGISGEAATDLLLADKARVTVLDDDISVQLRRRSRRLQRKGVDIKLGKRVSDNRSQFDLLVVSPGVPSSHRFVRLAKQRNIPVISELELAFCFLRSPLIAVTGTNGKTTTVTLITRMLKRSGFNCTEGGNIGVPLSRVALSSASFDLVVAEVSSFQLENIRTFRPQTALFLNITPDHLDRYPDLRSYRDVKMRLFRNQKEGDWAVIPSNSSAGLVAAIPPPVQKIYWGGKEGMVYRKGQWFRMSRAGDRCAICRWREIKAIGAHSLKNMMAAAAVALLQGVDRGAIRQTLLEFKGLPHRIEYVLTHRNIRFYNDSKATNPGAVKAALASFSGPVIWIAGGIDKGLDFNGLRSQVSRSVKLAILMGESRRKLGKVFAGDVPCRLVDSLPEAVELAGREASPGDVVLLSPGCTSFDLFRNYKERGELFKSLVRKLSGKIRY